MNTCRFVGNTALYKKKVRPVKTECLGLSGGCISRRTFNHFSPIFSTNPISGQKSLLVKSELMHSVYHNNWLSSLIFPLDSK